MIEIAAAIFLGLVILGMFIESGLGKIRVVQNHNTQSPEIKIEYRISDKDMAQAIASVLAMMDLVDDEKIGFRTPTPKKEIKPKVEKNNPIKPV